MPSKKTIEDCFEKLLQNFSELTNTQNYKICRSIENRSNKNVNCMIIELIKLNIHNLLLR